MLMPSYEPNAVHQNDLWLVCVRELPNDWRIVKGVATWAEAQELQLQLEKTNPKQQYTLRERLAYTPPR